MLLGALCADTANVWNVLGYIVTIVKIVIPVALIVLGMVDLGKAVISSDDKAISKSVTTLVKRFIAAVVVFFVPTIVSAVFGMLNIMSDPKDFNICVQCLTDRAGTVCTSFQKCALGSSSYDATACGNALTNYYR